MKWDNEIFMDLILLWWSGPKDCNTVADALQWQMPSSGKCPPVADALQWQMPSSGRCPPVADALQWHLTHWNLTHWPTGSIHHVLSLGT